jgi:N-acetylglucosaminyl-diphospho-decaprenol L-rhamnosyltransferase
MHDMHQTLRTIARGADTNRWLRPNYDYAVSAVIVNYNSRAMLERTLATLYGSQPRCSLEVIVIDNASSDDSAAMVRAGFPQVRLVVNEQNAGLTRANNQGMELATGRHLLLLNNDLIIHPGAIDALVEYLDAHPTVGAVGGKVLNIDGSIQGTVKAHPTPLAALFGRHSPLTRLFPNNRFSRRYLVYQNPDTWRAPFAAGSVSSCAVLVRREAIVAAGPVDERFFCYWSDVDWCRSFWEAGYAVHCVPASVIVHDEHKGGTRATKRRSRAAVVDFHRGAYLYYSKWHVRRAWHPNHLLALGGLVTRGALVLAAEQARWARMRQGER